MNIFNVRGTHRDGREVASLFFLAGGVGAHEGLDGTATTPTPSNMGVVPTEVWENLTSMSVVRRELLADSGGAGKHRGGVGQEVELRNDTNHPLTISLMGLRTQFAAQGFQGGKPGQVRRYAINGQTVHPKGRYTLSPGDTILIHEAGGAGFGNPTLRSRDAIRHDLRSGLVTSEGLLRDYGVSLESIK